LILAYKQGYLKIFHYLLKYLNINQKDMAGNTILFYAIDKDDKEEVKELISMGADINEKNYIGNSILDHAIFTGKSENKSLLLMLLDMENLALNEQNGKGETPLISLIRSTNYTVQDKVDMVTYLVKRGSKINVVDGSNNSPLLYAIKNNYTEVAKFLIRNGAQVNITNKEGITPLDLAIKTKSYDLVNYFYDRGTDVYQIKQISFEALKQVVVDDNLELLKKLMIHSINIDDINKKSKDNGFTPLHFAISLGNAEMVKYLLEYGANKYTKNYADKDAYDINLEYNKFNNIYYYLNNILNSFN